MRGGVALYASNAFAANVTLLHKSVDSERLWAMVHSDLGPCLVGVWYRPPVQGEQATIASFCAEWEENSNEAIGTILVVDLNIHHKKWLRWLSGNSAEGEKLRTVCVDSGLKQLVHGPTRGDYLLDLVLSDCEGVKCKKLPQIADHSLILAELDLPMLACETIRW